MQLLRPLKWVAGGPTLPPIATDALSNIAVREAAAEHQTKYTAHLSKIQATVS
jgi:hypothetical protein